MDVVFSENDGDRYGKTLFKLFLISQNRKQNISVVEDETKSYVIKVGNKLSKALNLPVEFDEY